jgi:signal transduction histidine kinase
LVLLGLFLLYWLYTVWTDFYGTIVHGETDYWTNEMLPYILVALALMSTIVIAFVVLLRNVRRENQIGRLKNDFISSISHELRSPISTIGIALEAMSNADYPPEQNQEFLRVSKLELERLNLLVEKVLRLSMFEAQEPTLNLEAVDMRPLVERVLDAMKLRAQRLQADISLHTETESALTVQGDPVHLSSVVFNLIDNALKYVDKAPVVRVALRRKETSVELEVSDNGIGIPEAFQERIFEKFFRVPPERTRLKARGHGLGLSYVAKVVEQHGGNIHLHSTEGKGSTFRIELPVRERTDEG